ncbi:MAG: glycosyltransferase [Methylomonas sp.]|nr:glycosyltransferase [Methylomonas sp.]
MDQRTPQLSIVIPLYNEAARLPPRIKPLIRYLDTHVPSYEIILVNDGSTDGTASMIKDLAREHPKIRGIQEQKNRGRGYGMRTGALSAVGDFILETDADVPVSPDHIIRFLSFLEKHPEFNGVIGSRGLSDSTFVLNQPWQRVFAGKMFHLIFGLLFDIHLSDVMCGFKMFRRRAAHEIFLRVYDERYLAAAEIILAARNLNLPLKEMPVAWEDNRESKVRIVRDSIRSFLGLFEMLLREWKGMYDTAMTIRFHEAARAVKNASGRWTWPALFTRIRFFTAPYFELSKHIPETGRIIDLGSGYGIFANLLGLMAPHRTITGLDLDKYKSDHAKALAPNVTFTYGDITKINVPPADCIMLIHVLHHLDSYEQQEVLLKACYEKIRPGGKLLICEIDEKPWWKFILTQIADHMLYPGDRIYYRFPGQLTPLLKGLGGDVSSMVMHQGTPFSHVTYIVTRR